MPPDTDTDTLISHIVARGYGVISCGLGGIVHYGPRMPENPGHGYAFVPNDIHDEEAECLLREAVLALRDAFKKGKSKTAVIAEINATTSEYGFGL
jgi:hypothetical protein